MDDTSHGLARQGAPHGLPLQGGGGAPNVAAAGPGTGRRHLRSRPRSRSVMVRRALVVADLVALTLAFVVAELALGPSPGANGQVAPRTELLLFLATLPVWLLTANLHRLYDRDETSTDHSTVDEIIGVFHLVAIGAWVVFASAWATGLADPNPIKLGLFAVLAVIFVAVARATARAIARRHASYRQAAVIVGAGHIGQLLARKLRQHPEYGIDVAGFVDDRPRELRSELQGLPMLGSIADADAVVRRLGVQRVIIAFTVNDHEEMLRLVRRLTALDVQIELIPRYFEVVGHTPDVDFVEGLPLLRLGAPRISHRTRVLKRAIDVIGATVGLVLTGPVMLAIALAIKLDSPGPVLFKQVRLGESMREFANLKFRTMVVTASDEEHRAYINATMSSDATPESSGLYKLDRGSETTRVGRWLRRTSLDELPQLFNVLKGDISLVGPRPCIPYEVEHFQTHHLDRFLVPAGITGLWQVTARARSTFGEALDLDVAYVRSYSIWLDLKLLLRTPVQLVRQRVTA